MESPWVKYSGGKIVPHSDLRAGTTQRDANIKETNTLRVGAWNVRSLQRSGRLEDLKREMHRLGLDIVGISEVRWNEVQHIWSDNYRIITTKAEKGNAGVGIIMNKKIGQRVTYYEQHYERIIVIKIESKPKPNHNYPSLHAHKRS